MSAMLENMKRQFIVSGMMEPIITMVNNELNDVSLLTSVLLLVEQICITSKDCGSDVDGIDEYCIYLSNLGVIDSIESFLSIHKTEAELFLVAFRCFDNIISNSCIFALSC